jgi:hypothetical protein
VLLVSFAGADGVIAMSFSAPRFAIHSYFSQRAGPGIPCIREKYREFLRLLRTSLRARRHDHVQTLRRLPMRRAIPGACMSGAPLKSANVPHRVEIALTPAEAGIVKGGF